MLFRRIVMYALLVGAIAGTALTAVQFWQVIPIIQTAESYEAGGGSEAAHDHGEHDHGGGAWAPADGLERTSWTLVSNVLTGIGFAVLTLAAMVASLRFMGQTRLDWRHGLLWAAAGYAVFYLVPSIGVPPAIPGSVSAPLADRQVWWVLAAICTAGGLAGAAFIRSPWRWAALALLAVPFVIGAPEQPGPRFPFQPPEAAAALEALTRQFFAATAVANAVMWIVIGLVSVWAVRRIQMPEASGLVSPSV